jgi:hypothetical protein
VGGAVTVLYKAVRWMIATVRKLSRLADDLLGEPERPGEPARPGLMERVADLHRRLARVEALVHKELTRNGGSSMKDQVTTLADAAEADPPH